MATATRTRKPRTKPERKVHLYNADGNPKLIEMTIGQQTYSYFLSIIDADYGIGFEIRKLLPETDIYHVHYDPARGLSTCDCKGGAHHGHCKHQEAILALIRSAKLTVPQQSSKEPKPEPQPATTDKPAPKQPWCEHCNDNPAVYCSHCSL